METVVLPTPKDIVLTLCIYSYKFQITSVVLNTSVSLLIQFCDSQNFLLKEVAYTISGDDYLAWKTDDYITNYITANIDEIWSSS
jgi:hypothetical protein